MRGIRLADSLAGEERGVLQLAERKMRETANLVEAPQVRIAGGLALQLAR